MKLALTLLVTILAISAPQSSNAQNKQDEIIIDPILIFFKARLIDKLSGVPVPYANVINLRTRGGTTTDINGYFSMEMLNVDTMLISVLGYSKERITIPLDYKQNNIQQYELEAERYPIDNVDIIGKKREFSFGDLGTGKVDSLSPELRATTWAYKPKWWQAILQPLKYAEYNSKSEKERRQMREALATEADWQRLSKYYNQEMVYKITGLEGANADTFMMYFNANNKLSGKSTEYDVREAIVKIYDQYLKEKYKTRNTEEK